MNKSYMTQHYWKPEEDEWIKNKFTYYKKRSTMLLKFNQTFNTNITINALNQRLYKHRLLIPVSDYTVEMEEWINKNYRLDTKTAQQLTNEFNERFGTNKTKSSIWHKAFRLTGQRVSNEPKTRIEYSEEMLNRIRELVPIYSYKKVAEIMTEEFNYKFTSSMMEHKANRIGLKKPNNGFNNLDARLPSLNCFKKGHQSINKKPVGTESIIKCKNGRVYVVVKIADPNVWEFKHRLIWMEHNGEIPEGHNVIFADGDRMNFNIDNLLLVSNSEHCRLNKLHYRFNDGELTKTALNVVKLNSAIQNRKRKNKDGNKKHTN